MNFRIPLLLLGIILLTSCMKPVEMVKIKKLEDIIDDSQNYYYITHDSSYSVHTLDKREKIAELEEKPEAIIINNGEYNFIYPDSDTFKVLNSEGIMVTEIEAIYIGRTDSSLVLFDKIKDENYYRNYNDYEFTDEEYIHQDKGLKYRIFTYPVKHEIRNVTSIDDKYIDNELRIFCVDSLKKKINFNLSFQDVKLDEAYYKTSGWGQGVKLSYSVVGNDTIDGIKLDFSKIKDMAFVKLEKIDGELYILCANDEVYRLYNQNLNEIDKVTKSDGNYCEILKLNNTVQIGTREYPDRHWTIDSLNIELSDQILITDSVYYELYEHYEDFESTYTLVYKGKKVKSNFKPKVIRSNAINFKENKRIPLFITHNKGNVRLLNYKLQLLSKFKGECLNFTVNEESILMLVWEEKTDSKFLVKYDY